MTTEQIKAHYRAVMCKTFGEICNQTIGRPVELLAPIIDNLGGPITQ